MQKFKTGIVLVNYNSLQDTIDCVKSISEIDSDLPFIIVVDNNSRDQVTIETAFGFYPHIHVIKSSVNIGFGRANNLGIQWAQNNLICEFIYILNNDTTVEKSSLRKLEESFEADMDVVMVSPKIFIYSNPNEVWYGGGLINFNKVTPIIQNYMSDRTTDFASGCCMFFKSDFLYAIGGFDPFFFMYDEDVELCIRIKKLGKKITFINSSTVLHKCQGSQVSKGDDIPSNQLDPAHPSLLFYLSNTITNRRYIIRKHLKGFRKIHSCLFHTMYWLLKAAQYALHFKFKAFSMVFSKLCAPISRQIP